MADLSNAIIRPRTSGDTSRIFSDWLRSYRESPLTAGIGNDVYYHHEQAIIQALWERDGLVWLIACDKDDVDYIHGWCCVEHTDTWPVVHYVSVRSNVRRKGLATRLLDTATERAQRIIYVNETRHGRSLAEKFRRCRGTALYVPYAKYYHLPPDWWISDGS